MSQEDRQRESPGDIANRINRVGRYSRLSKIGFGIIILAFGMVVGGRLPYNLGSIPAAVDAILLPLIFVGIGFLLLGIGMHLHLMHLNIVRQMQKASMESKADDREDSP